LTLLAAICGSADATIDGSIVNVRPDTDGGHVEVSNDLRSALREKA
jgi:hypothetical protein